MAVLTRVRNCSAGLEPRHPRAREDAASVVGATLVPALLAGHASVPGRSADVPPAGARASCPRQMAAPAAPKPFLLPGEKVAEGRRRMRDPDLLR